MSPAASVGDEEKIKTTHKHTQKHDGIDDAQLRGVETQLALDRGHGQTDAHEFHGIRGIGPTADQHQLHVE